MYLNVFENMNIFRNMQINMQRIELYIAIQIYVQWFTNRNKSN